MRASGLAVLPQPFVRILRAHAGESPPLRQIRTRPELARFSYALHSRKENEKGAQMAEREIDSSIKEVPEIPETLSSLLSYAVGEAREKFDQQGGFDPFTVIAVADKLFFETVEGETDDEMIAFAKHTVEHVRGADAYAFCYDGYLATDDGERDVIIAEGGIPGVIQGETVGQLYEQKADGTTSYHEQLIYLGKAPNFMLFLTPDTDPLLHPAEEFDEGVAVAEGAQEASEAEVPEGEAQEGSSEA